MPMQPKGVDAEPGEPNQESVAADNSEIPSDGAVMPTDKTAEDTKMPPDSSVGHPDELVKPTDDTVMPTDVPVPATASPHPSMEGPWAKKGKAVKNKCSALGDKLKGMVDNIRGKSDEKLPSTQEDLKKSKGTFVDKCRGLMNRFKSPSDAPSGAAGGEGSLEGKQDMMNEGKRMAAPSGAGESNSFQGDVIEPVGCPQRAAQIFATISLAFFFSVFFLVPIIFFMATGVRRSMVFGHNKHDQRIFFGDTPEDHGMKCTSQVYYTMDDGNRIGVWEMALEKHDCKMYESKKPIVFFLHGNSGTRGTTARKEKYEMLRKLELEVITLDYRGFGDSQGVPSANSVNEDVRKVYDSIREHKKAKDIIIWGHSLGTGIGTMFLAGLNETVGGLVLETPFDTIGAVFKLHKDMKIFRVSPFFDFFFVNRLNNHPVTAYRSTEYVKDINVRMPIFIFATEDDATVPAVLAKRLFDAIVEHRNSSKNTFMKLFDAKYGYGHMYVHKSRETPRIVEKLLEICCKNF